MSIGVYVEEGLPSNCHPSIIRILGYTSNMYLCPTVSGFVKWIWVPALSSVWLIFDPQDPVWSLQDTGMSTERTINIHLRRIIQYLTNNKPPNYLTKPPPYWSTSVSEYIHHTRLSTITIGCIVIVPRDLNIIIYSISLLLKLSINGQQYVSPNHEHVRSYSISIW